MRFACRPLSSNRGTTLENCRRAVQQLLLPGVNLVRGTPYALASSATIRSPMIAASATLALNAAPCFLRVCFMSCSSAIGASLGAGLHLNQLSHFRGPAQMPEAVL